MFPNDSRSRSEAMAGWWPRLALTAAFLSGLLAGCAPRGEPARLPPFALVNQDGRPVRTEDLRGRVTVLTVMFARCAESCPLVTARLVRAQAELRAAGLTGRVRFVSITVDPLVDAPAILARYAARVGADTSAWDFLTGPPEQVQRLVHGLDVPATNEGGRIGHGDVVLVVDAGGRIVERAAGTALAPSAIVARIRRAVARDASARTGW